MLTLGFYVRPWMKVNYPDLPAIGRFEANYFRPERWKPEYPNPAFDNARPDDLFWGAAAVVAITDEAILEVGPHGGVHGSGSDGVHDADPDHAPRQDRAALAERGVAGRRLHADADGTFTFSNIAVESKAATRGAGYTVAWATLRQHDRHGHDRRRAADHDRASQPAAPPRARSPASSCRSTVTGKHRDHPGWSLPCRVVFRKQSAGWKLVGVERM